MSKRPSRPGNRPAGKSASKPHGRNPSQRFSKPGAKPRFGAKSGGRDSEAFGAKSGAKFGDRPKPHGGSRPSRPDARGDARQDSYRDAPRRRGPREEDFGEPRVRTKTAKLRKAGAFVVHRRDDRDDDRRPSHQRYDNDRERTEKRAEKPVTPPPTKVTTVIVTPDEAGMRVDRFLEARYGGLSYSHIQRVIRKGELRINGKRADSKDRLEEGWQVRIPPLNLPPPKNASGLSEADEKTREFLKSITMYEDDDVLVLNKPAGLAVQGGSGTTRHIDGMLEVLRGRGADAQRPRLVHRLDKDTAGCLLVAKTRFAAAALAKSFRSRSARKIYWALVAGVPKPKQGRISTYLAKDEREDESVMRVAEHGDEGASHAVTYYAVVEASAQKLAWVSLKPVTGRTHQLRAHMAHVEHPIIGDPKYFKIENWELPGGIQNKLHLLARRIVIPHPRGGAIDATAPLPPHMQQSWNLLGLETSPYDPIEEAPED
jgi:23S rRNA pseudouridine955/2504/2580 synthase